MLRRRIYTRPVRHANYSRANGFTPKHIAKFRQLVPKLIKTYADKISEHNFGHWAFPRQSQPCRCPDDSTFGDRCINHAVWAKFIKKTWRCSPYAACRFRASLCAHTANDIFAQYNDIVVPNHFIVQSFRDCFTYHHFSHGNP